ncbi:Gldg family protein [Pseudobacter ginsenosidimutans]|uniref:ABC-2 type transport system permease protein n=1 Tax=Pseudobacter ginsenosidimutans TaxID=661488 RepID=A0A4Q7MX71_9BACT|nr:Gldg family protein [Pseudobacter ginsenosidimutans]QEC41538.1 ABC transporter permease subunit [Pseudobacter ginsenosidimutans]RZS71680.1 ABC-2 type transport system permease protein [Pseudobacter ginsenosidimutans]
MKRILYVAKNELYSLFYSPIAWILMIFFMILTSADYIASLDAYTGIYERGGPALMALQNLTAKLLSSGNGLFGSVIRNLYLFFPLITMGLISREVNNGTIKLLYSSPVRIREIVLGKYLAILCFTLCLLFLVCLTVISFAFSVENPDYGNILASLFGLFLVLATYAAIGLFISAVTSYQIVAAIITFGVFAFLSKVGELWQDIDILRNITYYLNFGGKAGRFLVGLMNLRDFTYFLIIIVSFLSFTIIKIKSDTESVSGFRKAMRYISVIAIAFVVGYITNKPQVNMYYDATREKIFTIHPNTQELLKKMDGKLEIILYGNLLGHYYPVRPAAQLSIIAMWERYLRFKPDIDIDFKYYYNLDTSNYRFKNKPGRTLKQIAEEEARTYRTSLARFMSPEEAGKLADIVAEENRCFFVLKYNGKETIVRTFDDPAFWPGESEVAAGLSRLVAADMPKIGFLSDEIERGPFSDRLRDYRVIANQLGNRYSLVNQGFDFVNVSLKNNEIPTALTALVIADPRTPFPAESLEKINRYIDEGGNLLIAGEPDRKEVIKPLFNKLGLTFRDGMLIQPTEKYSSDVVFSYMTDTAKNFSPQFRRLMDTDTKYRGDSLHRVALAGASAIEYTEQSGFHIDPLLITDKDLSWNRTAPVSNDSLQLNLTRTAGDESGSFVTAVRMNRKVNGKDQRIIVSGDADYLATPQLSGSKPARYNYLYGTWSFSYFTEGKFPANVYSDESIDNKFKITVDSIPTFKLIFYWIIPAIIGVICSVIIIRRKRK